MQTNPSPGHVHADISFTPTISELKNEGILLTRHHTYAPLKVTLTHPSKPFCTTLVLLWPSPKQHSGPQWYACLRQLLLVLPDPACFLEWTVSRPHIWDASAYAEQLPTTAVFDPSRETCSRQL